MKRSNHAIALELQLPPVWFRKLLKHAAVPAFRGGQQGNLVRDLACRLHRTAHVFGSLKPARAEPRHNSPSTMNDSPPTIFFPWTSRPPARICRIRWAVALSYPMALRQSSL